VTGLNISTISRRQDAALRKAQNVREVEIAKFPGYRTISSNHHPRIAQLTGQNRTTKGQAPFLLISCSPLLLDLPIIPESVPLCRKWDGLSYFDAPFTAKNRPT